MFGSSYHQTVVQKKQEKQQTQMQLERCHSQRFVLFFLDFSHFFI